MNTKTLLLTMLIVAIVEMGDKTQLLVLAMASKYKIKDILWGIVLSIVLLNSLAVGLGAALSNLLPLNLIHLLAGAAFLIFALWSVWENEDNTPGNTCTFFGRMPFAFSIGIIFFMAELGDKTQLYIISISAASPAFAPAIFWGATLGLVLADAIGILAGLLLSKNLPSYLIKWISYCIFSGSGLLTLDQNLHYFWPGYEKGHLVFIAFIFWGLTAAVEKLTQQKKAAGLSKYHTF